MASRFGIARAAVSRRSRLVPALGSDHAFGVKVGGATARDGSKIRCRLSGLPCRTQRRDILGPRALIGCRRDRARGVESALRLRLAAGDLRAGQGGKQRARLHALAFLRNQTLDACQRLGADIDLVRIDHALQLLRCRTARQPEARRDDGDDDHSDEDRDRPRASLRPGG